MGKMDKIKTHFDENKKVYAALGIGVTVGAAVTVIAFRNNPEVAQKINQIAIGYKNKQVLINFVERSTSSKPVHLKGTNLYFNSLSEAARETGYNLSQISKNVNGHIPDVNGDVFELLTPAA